ncbi:polysaccharide biosynthesis protein [Lactiplantibacillus paraxiangfangensis]|uniref:polysaccharide biosynthesis protein n=1 Tax=Lactiplantibacillus paraxiangfangensis TaxID=3076224 RepID=UPI0030C662C1
MMTEKQFYHVQRAVLILAVGLIVFGYTGPNGVFNFLEQAPDIFFYPQLIIATVTTAGSSLLMMALGAQQLRQPRYRLPQLIRLILFIVGGITLFSFVFYVEEVFLTKVVIRFSFSGYLATLAEAPDSFYYVIYEVLGFFVTLPLLRILAAHVRTMDIKYLFWIQLVFIGLIPILLYYTGVTTISITPPIAITNGCYFTLMGFWLSQRDFIWRITREQLIVAWLLTFCCYTVMISTIMYQANFARDYDLIGNLPFSQTLQAIPCLTVWVTIATKVLNKTKLKAPRKNNFVKMSYAVLLMTGVVLSPLQFISQGLRPLIGIWWSGLVWVLCTLILSYAIVIGLQYVPWFQKFFPNLFYNPTINKG